MEEYTSHPLISQHTAAFAYRSHFLFKLKNISIPFSENYRFLMCFTFGVMTLPTLVCHTVTCDYPPFFLLLCPHRLQKCFLIISRVSTLLYYLITNCRYSQYFICVIRFLADVPTSELPVPPDSNVY